MEIIKEKLKESLVGEFEERENLLIKDNYEKTIIAPTPLEKTLLIILMIIGIIGSIVVMIFLSSDFSLDNVTMFVITTIALIGASFIHEILHGIGIGLGIGFDKVVFSHRNIVALTTYAKGNLSKANYLLECILPFVVLGLLTQIIAWKTMNAYIWYFSVAEITGCTGDIIVFLKLLFTSGKGKEMVCVDHPVRSGLHLYVKTL